jgi:hypothetical protein
MRKKKTRQRQSKGKVRPVKETPDECSEDADADAVPRKVLKLSLENIGTR